MIWSGRRLVPGTGQVLISIVQYQQHRPDEAHRSLYGAPDWSADANTRDKTSHRAESGAWFLAALEGADGDALAYIDPFGPP
jgi:hypothetical protein